MAIGPWYVSDTPTTPLAVEVYRTDGTRVNLSEYSGVAVVLIDPAGVPGNWPGTPTIEPDNTVVIPAPVSSPFPTAGTYTLHVRLTASSGGVETFRITEVLVTSYAAWPPSLAELKIDMQDQGMAGDTDRDVELQQVLDAAVALVERVHVGRYNFTNDLVSTLPIVPPDMRTGAMRLAARWHTRRRSPEMLVSGGELGTARIPSVDADLERMLQLGRYRGIVFA